MYAGAHHIQPARCWRQPPACRRYVSAWRRSVVIFAEPINDGQQVARPRRWSRRRAAARRSIRRRSGDVGTAVVGEYFDEEADYACKALDIETDRTFAAMACYASAPRGAVHRALSAIPPNGRPDMLRQRRGAGISGRGRWRAARYASVFFDAISPPSIPTTRSPPSRVVAEMLAEGVFGVLRTCDEHRIDELPAALPGSSRGRTFFGPGRRRRSRWPFAAAAVAASTTPIGAIFCPRVDTRMSLGVDRRKRRYHQIFVAGRRSPETARARWWPLLSWRRRG